MSLTLTIASYQRLSPGQEITRELAQGSLAIGRATDNDWVLPDPEMILSKRHCVIECRDGGYYLTDISTNGVFVNHAEERVGRGNSVRLNDADVLSLGDYELHVHIVQVSLAGGPSSSTPLLGDNTDLFGPATEKLEFGDAGVPPVPDRAAFDSGPGAPWSGDSDPLGLDESRGDHWDQLSEPDHLPSDQQFFQPPAAQPDSPQDADIIPDDWNDSLLRPVSEPSSPDGDGVADPFGPTSQYEPAGQALGGPPLGTATPALLARNVGGERALLQAFLRGAGVDETVLEAADPEAVMAQLGSIYRLTVEGLMELLRARSNVKTEFRVERTMLGPVANNPLKALPTADEAIAAMLGRHDSVWQSPEQSVREGFADIRAHELAVLAGMQAALKRMLMTFDPQNLERYMEGQSRLAGVLGGGRKARYWDAFKGLYGRLAAKAEEDFEALFREEFARAYEAQQNKLREQ